MTVPVTHQQAVKTHLILQCPGQQLPASVHLDTIHATKRNHNGLHTGIKSRHVTLCMNINDFFFAGNSVALVLPVQCSTIAKKMLGCRQHVSGAEKVFCSDFTLNTLYHLSRVFAHDDRVFRVTFISPAPTVISGNCERRRKSPRDTSDGNLNGGNFTNTAYQFRVVCGAQTNIVRKQRGTIDITVSVHRVGSPDDGDSEATV